MFKKQFLFKTFCKHFDNTAAFRIVKISNRMQKTDTKISADLQKFIDKFEPNKFKMLSRGIEIRGNNDLYQSITFAKELIEKMKLKLAVHHSAEMAMYGGFEVVYL